MQGTPGSMLARGRRGLSLQQAKRYRQLQQQHDALQAAHHCRIPERDSSHTAIRARFTGGDPCVADVHVALEREDPELHHALCCWLADGGHWDMGPGGMLLSLTWKPFPACHRAVDEDELLRAVLRVPGLCDEDLALIAGVVLRLLKVTWWCAEAPLGVSQARVPQAVQLCDQYLELLCQHPNLGPACIAVLANGFGQLPVRIQPRVYQIITGIDAEIGEASLALAGHLDASQLEDAVRLLMAHEAAP